MADLIEHTRPNSAVPPGLRTAFGRLIAPSYAHAGHRAQAPVSRPHNDRQRIMRQGQNPAVWRRPDKELAFTDRLGHIAAHNTVLLRADPR